MLNIMAEYAYSLFLLSKDQLKDYQCIRLGA